MSAFRVVEHFDVIEDIGPSLFPGCVNLALDSLPLEQLKKALGDGVVVSIAFSFRAPTYGTMPQKLAKLDAFMAFLIEEYSRVLSHGHLQNCLREFDRQYPKARGITPVKKVDFVLWTYGRLLKQAEKAARSAPKRP